eukprot:g4212.t1
MGLGSLITCSTVGVIGDSFGRRAALLVCCFGALTQTLALLFVPASEQDTVLYTLIIVASLAGGQYAPPHVSFASLADVTSALGEHARTRVFSVLESSCWVGDTVGPFLGGVMVHWLGAQRSYAFAVACFCAMTAFVLSPYYVETLPQARRQPFSWAKANPLGSLWMLTNNRTALGFSLVVLFALLSVSGGITVIPFIAMDHFGEDERGVGYIMSCYFASNAAGLFGVLPLLLQRGVRPKTVVLIAVGWNAATWLLWSAAQRAWLLYVLASIAMLSAMFFPVTRAIVAATFGPSQYGASLAALGTVQQITQMAAPPTATQAWRALKQPAYLAIGAVGAVAFVIGCLVPVKTAPERAEDAGAESGHSNEPLLSEETK